MHQNLFGQLVHISGLILNVDDTPLCELLLFGDTQLNVASNRKILEATTSLIKNTKRFSNTNKAALVAIFVLSHFFISLLLIAQPGVLKEVLLFAPGKCSIIIFSFISFGGHASILFILI